MNKFIEIRVFIAYDGDFIMWTPHFQSQLTVVRAIPAPGDTYVNKVYNFYRLRVPCSDAMEREAQKMAADPDVVREVIGEMERLDKAPWRIISPAESHI